MTDGRRGEGFLARWSRRKEATPETREREDSRVAEERGDDAPIDAAPVAQAAPADLPSPETLTPQSDFTRFMRPDVPSGLRNAAMKKLFADPHFNLMDGLDVYIDDYTRPDPIPPAMLRELAQAGMLKLFDAVEEARAEAAPRGQAEGGDEMSAALADRSQADGADGAAREAGTVTKRQAVLQSDQDPPEGGRNTR